MVKHEECVIGGVMHFREDTEASWIRCGTEKLTKMLLEAREHQSVSNKLPMVLVYPITRKGKPDTEAISVERALKQALELMEAYPMSDALEMEDRINATVDDLRLMVNAVRAA